MKKLIPILFGAVLAVLCTPHVYGMQSTIPDVKKCPDKRGCPPQTKPKLDVELAILMGPLPPDCGSCACAKCEYDPYSSTTMSMGIPVPECGPGLPCGPCQPRAQCLNEPNPASLTSSRATLRLFW